MRRDSLSPPQWVLSVCMMLHARFSRKGRTAYWLMRRSQVAIEPYVIAHRPGPQFVAGDAMALPQDIPERDVNAADGGSPHRAVAVPEVLAVHHLPEVLDAGRIFAQEQRLDVLNGPDDGA